MQRGYPGLSAMVVGVDRFHDDGGGGDTPSGTENDGKKLSYYHRANCCMLYRLHDRRPPVLSSCLLVTAVINLNGVGLASTLSLLHEDEKNVL